MYLALLNGNDMAVHRGRVSLWGHLLHICIYLALLNGSSAIAGFSFIASIVSAS